MKKLSIIFIFLLAFVLRFYRLADFPAGPNLDEVSQGYTAYSILKTGRDEWGELLPLSPRAFGDYRSPLYTYLLLPPLAISGLNEFSLRFPAAFLGSLAVVVLYFLVQELFGQTSFALLASFLLAINPWHLSLSRGAFEASLHVFLFPFGFWLFLKGLKSQKYLWGSAVIFGLNLFSYYSPRFFTPMAVACLLFFFRQQFFRKKTNLIFGLIFGFFLALSFYALLMGGKTRVSDTSLLKPTDRWQRVSDRQYTAVWAGLAPFFEKIFNNKVISVTTDFYKQYLDYFSFSFLFSRGPAEATYGMIPGRGVLYLYELPLILYALYKMVKEKNKKAILILFLLLISPLSAAFAKGERAANRAIPMLPFWQVMTAFGLVTLLCRWRKLILSFFCLSFFFLLFFLEDYFYHAPRENAPNMSYGWRQISHYLKQNEQHYQKIVISKRFSEPQIAVAYFLEVNPQIVQRFSPAWLDYQKRGFLFVDQLPEYSLDKYEFRNFRFPEDKNLKNTLFIGKADDFIGLNGQVEKIIYYPGPEQKIAMELRTFDLQK